MSNPGRFEILCVTMNQADFSKVEEMNIHSNVVFSNQASSTGYEEKMFDGFSAKMITTDTRGVGKNRNIGLLYANAEICLFADDDVVYADDVEELVLKEFDAHPDADVFIFHLDTDDENRKQKKYKETRKCTFFERMPWGGVRIAFRLDSMKKANVWFTTLFGGGCVFASGEDSMWLKQAKKKGLTFYVSKETIGKVSFEDSSWFSGYDEKFFYSKGAFYRAVHSKTRLLWMLYFAFRVRGSKLSYKEKMSWMKKGKDGYDKMLSYDEYKSLMK